MAVRNMMAFTPSKQWIHFRLSDLCPPTSTILEIDEGSNNTWLDVLLVHTYWFSLTHGETDIKLLT